MKKLWIAVIIMLNIAAQAELIGHWDFDNVTNGIVRDLSGKKHDGMIHGKPEIVDGISGKALRFKTNDDYVDFGAPLIPAKDFTISVWINCNDVEKQFFLGQYKYGDPERLDLAVCNGCARIQIDKIIDSPKLIEPGKWYNIVFTRKSGILKIYIDGNMVLEKELPGNVIATEHLILGRLFVPKRNDFRFTGIIDDLKIWDSPITDIEVKEEFGNRK